ncbi:MAG: transketolase [Spirochaetales bacterium]|nr:transketolase [Spirochaetales bacterium]
MKYEIKELEKMAKRIRLDVMEMVYDVKDGHPGPCFSITEIVTALYFGGIINVDPENPLWMERDRFVLSKGHACPAVYSALARRGFFPSEELLTLRKIDSRIQGHPYIYKTPGIDASTGSLGNGIATAVGMAKGLKIKKDDAFVYTVIGDGEMNEGIVWEALMAASHHRLSNLIVFLDNNLWQSGGSIEDISGLNNLDERVKTFGWNTISIDGHDYTQIRDAVTAAKAQNSKPNMIVCSTVKGKGLPFTESDNSWHKRVPTDEQMVIAREILSGVSK